MRARDLTAVIARLAAAGCVYADEEAELLAASAADAADLSALVQRRVDGLPLEQVLGWAGFYGLRLTLEPGVFVPRRRTEFLVDRAVALAPGPGGTVVDLCCGCGAIAAALAGAVCPARLYASDIDPAAVRCAERNLAGSGAVTGTGDLYTTLPDTLRGHVDLLVANVPYVPSTAVALLPPEARLYEARVALDGGPDGLDVLRRVAADAPGWLAPGGHLLVETGVGQADAAGAVMAAAGLVPDVAHDEDRDATVVTGTRR